MVKSAEFLKSGSESDSEESKEINPKAIFVKNCFQFGKYAQRNIAEVFKEDEAYCKWYLNNIDDGSKHKIFVKNKLRSLFELSE